MKNLLLILLVAVTGIGTYAQEAKSLPSLTLSNINGKKINVDEYGKSGKMTLFGFWATWCNPCKKELSNMTDMYKKWREKYGLQIVAVSIDDAKSIDKVKSFLQGEKWNYDILLDVDQNLKRAFNVPSVPYIIIVDAKGKVIFTHSGYNEGDEYVLEQELQKLKSK